MGKLATTPREFIEKYELPNDSLGMLDLVVEIEDAFDIIITQAEAAEVTSIEGLIQLVERKVE